jgi:hypothetical protein
VSDLRLYVSFDLEHDRDLQARLLAESQRADFVIASRSEGGGMTEAWSARVRARITESDEVLVICGEHTDVSPRMSAELKIAQEQHKPYLLLWGRRDSMCKKPRGARAGDGMYMWTPATLEQQLVQGIRRSRERPVPEGLRRQPTTPREA